MRRPALTLLCCGLLAAPALATAQQRTPPRPTRADTTRRPPATRPTTPTRRPAPTPARAAQARRPAPPPNERTLAVSAGAALADLEFGIGPSLGFVARYRNGRWPIAARANGVFSYFSQTPTLGGSALGDKATLSHFGLEGGIEFPLGVPKASAPYVMATAGVFRFAGSGPAGDAGDIPDGVYGHD
jgi:hypothetical protein